MQYQTNNHGLLVVFDDRLKRISYTKLARISASINLYLDVTVRHDNAVQRDIYYTRTGCRTIARQGGIELNTFHMSWNMNLTKSFDHWINKKCRR